MLKIAHHTDGVRRLNTRVDAPVFSPSGRFLAFWKTRGADVNLVARECVHVLDVTTGREVCALDGPDIVRAVAFVSDDALLTLRDRRAGAVVGLWALPDGGLLHEQVFARAGQMETELQVSADGRTAYAAPVWRAGTRNVPHGLVFSVPELVERYRVDPYPGHVGGVDLRSHVAGRSRLDPDGLAVALYASDHNASQRLVVHRFTRPGAPVEVLAVPVGAYHIALTWLSPHTLALIAPRSSPNLTTVSLELELSEPATMRDRAPRAKVLSRLSAVPGAVDGDRAHVIARRTTESERDALRLVRVVDGAVVGPIQGVVPAEAGCFTHDNLRAVTVHHAGSRAKLCAHRLANGATVFMGWSVDVGSDLSLQALATGELAAIFTVPMGGRVVDILTLPDG